MSRSLRGRRLVLGVTPFEEPNARLAVAVARAGGLGVLDLGRDLTRARAALADATRLAKMPIGVRVPYACPVPLEDLGEQVDTVVLAAGSPWHPAAVGGGRLVLAEVSSLLEARGAIDAGVGGVIARGSEGGGRVGELSTFVLLQQLLTELEVDVWAAGGIGLHTAAAAIAGGAAGVVLDVQLALVKEAGLGREVASAIAAMDGSETSLVDGHRVYRRPDLPALTGDTGLLLGTDLRTQLLPVGQDAAFSRPLAQRYVTAGGVVQAVKRSIEEHLHNAVADDARAAEDERAGSARPTRIVQGPMTRVSDQPAFAAAVAGAGGLPLLALALMTGAQVRALLQETSARLGELPWGVGILGFTPPEVREAQMAEVREARPLYALIAGGRPSQAAQLEAVGVATFLHAPSPGLLDLFLREGARRFVFEGSECGGHVGPQASFPLWETQIEHLLAFGGRHPEALAEVEVLFAGGIHDERSAAMVHAAAAPLAARGAAVGVLMGTAYLFTEEAVTAGAIVPAFQEQALACDRTVLLETSPGHATRCAPSPFVRVFEETQRRLAAEGRARDEAWAELEQLNLGRLRIAAKGLRREGPDLLGVDGAEQRRDGMYMIGQAAVLRTRPTTIARLHAQVTDGARRFLSERVATLAEGLVPPTPVATPFDIAIVGMACVLPGAADVETFWANVVNGVDAITEVSPERWDPELYFDPDPAREPNGKTPSKWGGFVPQVPFDALAYGITPASLSSIEPTQLLALDVAARALDDAGYANRPFDRERASVIFGAEAGTDLAAAYGFRSAVPSYFGTLPPTLDDHLPRVTEDSFPGVLANVIAGRIANRLDLGGVNYTVDAACASSLAALDVACKELRSGTSDMVLCGGADLHNGIHDYLMFSSVHALSPSGRCATFDGSADGIALGEGVACVVLKRLADAERDGDRVYAVVKSVAGSSDGRSLGLTAPRLSGQRESLERAYRTAGVSPAQVGLVEAHGTGTVVGDRTELAALSEVFEAAGAAAGSCAVGSVKSQIGHTKCAAGMAGLIKAARAVHAGVRPATLHLRHPNDYWDQATSPFFFDAQSRPWAAEAGDRIAGVSAFGFGGTNFHAVVAGYGDGPEPRHGLAEWPAELFVFRGEDATAADKEIGRLRELVAANEGAGRPWPLRDLAYTTAVTARQAAAPVQMAMVVTDLDDLAEKLEALESAAAGGATGPVVARRAGSASDDKVAFLFPGQGSQEPGMLAELFVAFPPLKRLLGLGGGRYARLMFPPASFTAEERQAQRVALTDTRVAQPALGIAGLAAFELLRALGVRPDMVAGHSYGELVALCAAGVFEADDLITLSEGRAHSIVTAAGADPGAMAAVGAPAAAVVGALAGHPGVVIANYNSPGQTVISGPTEAVEAAVASAAADGLAARRIPVACAFHSPVVAAAATSFAALIAGTAIGRPAMPVWSNTTAAPFNGDIATTVARQVAEPVRFVEEIEAMHAAGARVFVEVGPGRVLTGLVGSILGDRPHRAVALEGASGKGVRGLLGLLGDLVCAGLSVDVEALFTDRAKVVSASGAPARPGWLVDGRGVRHADGSLLDGGMRPPVVLAGHALASIPAATPSGQSHDDAVLQFLRGSQEMLAAQRDVVLALLGTPSPSLAATALPALAAPAPEPVVSSPAFDEPETSPQVDVSDLLLEVISARTGYPREMLDPDLDLEADLSIGSIKRAEIVGELSQQLGLAGDRPLDDALIEELSRLKTIKGIVGWLRANVEGGEVAEAAAVALVEDEASFEPDPLRRYVVDVVGIDHTADPDAAPSFRRCDVVDDGRGVAVELVRLLGERGVPARVVGDGESLEGADAVVHLAGLRQAGDPLLPRSFGELRDAVVGGTRALIVATGSAGTFGHGWTGDGRSDPSTGIGVRGLLRTVAREHPDILVRAVDVDLREDPGKIAARLFAELADRTSPVVVGYTNGTRSTLDVIETPLRPGGTIDLGSDSVVMITGGARGITARIALGLAAATGCAVELVGRTPLPSAPEDGATAGATDEISLRRAVLESGVREPRHVESCVRRILAAREVTATLAGLAATGSAVRYHAVDIRDAEAIGAVVADVYARHGRLDGVIHGAGVSDDRLLRDKAPDAFARVFETKVAGARNLADALRPGVRFFVLFGSVSGVFGNKGQADYSAANDALDTMAAVWRHRLQTRVVAVDWGPWSASAGGMVTPALEAEYRRRGIATIDPAAGVAALLSELAGTHDDRCQVLYTSSLGFAETGPGA